ncbi:MAG TPA: small basic protein [Phycisphaerae bacterium]|nr:small basic protein [Phycisphaerae bacterium]
MSMDRSLKIGSGLVRHRNVLNRAERIAKLTELERWGEDKSAFGLPKVANRNIKVGKKAKKAAEDATAAAPGAPAAADAAAKKDSGPAKKDAPAKQAPGKQAPGKK